MKTRICTTLGYGVQEQRDRVGRAGPALGHFPDAPALCLLKEAGFIACLCKEKAEREDRAMRWITRCSSDKTTHCHTMVFKIKLENHRITCSMKVSTAYSRKGDTDPGSPTHPTAGGRSSRHPCRGSRLQRGQHQRVLCIFT